MTGSGILTYHIPVTSARTEPGEDAAPYAIGSLSNYTTFAHPNTGNLIEGWHWDERVWAEDSIENTAVTIPCNWDPTTSGITLTSFQSGIGSHDDLMLESIKEVPSSGLNTEKVYQVWSPVLNHGYFYDYSQEGYLFSDDSEINYVTYSGISLESGYDSPSGFNTITLKSRPKVGVPIKARQFEWSDQHGKYYVHKELEKRIQFSGQYSSGERLTTYSSKTELILWENIDQTRDEFIIDYSDNKFTAIFNKQYVEAVSIDTAPSGLEFLGYSTGKANQEFHTKYSPIDSSMNIAIYSYMTEGGPYTQWTAVSLDTTPSGYQAKVDYDLGIVVFGDPDETSQQVPEAGATIGIAYYKTIALEYEPENTHDTILATETNINPVYRRNSRGFVYLATQLEDPASITLEASLPEIQTDVFGPLNIGNSYCPVIATVKDSKGQLIEAQTVNFFINSSPAAGKFGLYTTASSVTDEYGEAKAYYNPPRSINEIGENVTASGWSQIDNPTESGYLGLSQITKLQTSNLYIDGALSDIFLYGVYINDPIQGYMDTTVDPNNTDAQLASYYTTFFNEHDIQGSTRDVEWEDAHRTIWQLARPALFSPNTGNGKKLIVATVDSTALNPYTFTPGAVSPMQPIDVRATTSGYNVVFDTSTYNIPQPTASQPVPSGTLYSYFLVAPTSVNIQASVFNSRLNQYILSNEISVKLAIPPYLSGLWILDAINQSEIDEVSSILASGIVASGQKVPLGFRLRSSQVTLAAALDGVTFLDINRPWNYDPYDPDTVSGIRLGQQITVTKA